MVVERTPFKLFNIVIVVCVWTGLFVVYLAMKGFGVYDSVLVAPWLQGICAFSLLRVGFAILTCVCVKPGHLWYRSASVPPMNQFNDDSKLFSDGLLGGWLSG